MKNNLSGFSTLILIVIIFVISSIGVIGYYVFTNQNDSMADSSDAIRSDANKSIDTKQVESQKPTNTEEKTAIVINELDIKIPYTDAKAIRYVYDNQTRESMVGVAEASVSFYIKEGILSDQTCNDLGLSLYVLNKKPEEWKHSKIGDKYYVITGSPSSCGDENDTKIRNSAISVLNASNIVGL